MTQEITDNRFSYGKDRMLEIKECVCENSSYFYSKYPVNIPYKTRVRMKNPSTCSNHGQDESNDLRGSRSSLGPSSRDHSDAEEYVNNAGWRRAVSNRGRGAPARQRFPSGSATNGSEYSNNFTRSGGETNKNHHPLWRQRNVSGSDRNSHQNTRGFFNNSRGGHRGGATLSGDFSNENNDSWSSYKYRGGRVNRGLAGRSRGAHNRNSYTEQNDTNDVPNSNFRHSYHNNQPDNDKFWDEKDWLDDEKPSKSSVGSERSSPPGLKQGTTEEPEQPIWIYIDPQEKVQGPFTSNVMSQWLELDYLPTNLLLRKVSERDYITLKDLCDSVGHKNPFAAQPKPISLPSNSSQHSDHQIIESLELISKFSPKDVEAKFMKFTEDNYPHIGDPRLITESLLKLNMTEIYHCLSDEQLLRTKIEELQPVRDVPEPTVPVEESVNAAGDSRSKNVIEVTRRCAMNEGSDGFHFEVEPISVTGMAETCNDSNSAFATKENHREVEKGIADLSTKLKNNIKISPTTQPDSIVQSSEDLSAQLTKKQNKKAKKKKGNQTQQNTESTKPQLPCTLPEDDAIHDDQGWISATKNVKQLNANETVEKKKKGKKSAVDTKTSAWEAEMDRRRKEQMEKRETIEAEEEAYNQMLADQLRQEKEERDAEAQSAIAALERREKRWQQTNLVLDNSVAPSQPMTTPFNASAKKQPGPVLSFAQIQAEQTAEEAARKDIRLKELQNMSGKAANMALNKPTGWASIVAVNTPVPPAVVQPQTTAAKKAVPTLSQPSAPNAIDKPEPLAEPISIWNYATTKSKSSKKKAKGSQSNGHPVKNGISELRTWCQSEMGSLPAINSAIDLPTVSGLICEMENKSQVMEFIETSFGNSKNVRKFTQEFLQRKSKLVP